MFEFYIAPMLKTEYLTTFETLTQAPMFEPNIVLVLKDQYNVYLKFM